MDFPPDELDFDDENLLFLGEKLLARRLQLPWVPEGSNLVGTEFINEDVIISCNTILSVTDSFRLFDFDGETLLFRVDKILEFVVLVDNVCNDEEWFVSFNTAFFIDDSFSSLDFVLYDDFLLLLADELLARLLLPEFVGNDEDVLMSFNTMFFVEDSFRSLVDEAPMFRGEKLLPMLTRLKRFCIVLPQAFEFVDP